MGFRVLLRIPQAPDARHVLAAPALQVSVGEDGALLVSGATPDTVGRAVASAGLTVYELRPVDRSLDVFLELTGTTERSGRRPTCCVRRPESC